MRQACEAQDNLADDIKNAKENVWAAFNALKEKEPEPDPVPEPAPAAEELAAEGAAEEAPVEA